jgi:hypothetical protein
MVFIPSFLTAPAAPAPTPAAPVHGFSANDVWFAVLRALLPVREVPANTNAGQMVEAFLQVCGHSAGQPWCMAVLSYAGRVAFQKRWPLRMTAGTNDAAAHARQLGILADPSAATVGDIALLWSPALKRFRHAFVLEARQADGKRWDTLEGNTNAGGSREGNAFMRRSGDRGRVLQPGDRVIQWHRGLKA